MKNLNKWLRGNRGLMSCFAFCVAGVVLFCSCFTGGDRTPTEVSLTDVMDDGEPFTGEFVEQADGGDGGQPERDGGEAESWSEFAVTGVSPSHGPFIGGTTVMVKGRGFEEGAVVYFGQHSVQLAFITYINENRIQVITPASAPGTVDVKVVQGDDEAVLRDGFSYDVFYVDPPSGSIAGGTYVEITGWNTNFEPASDVKFDGNSATDIDWISPTKVTCKTPPGNVGSVNVSVIGHSESYEVEDAYSYYNHADPVNGGLGGGPIDGSVNITVLNAIGGEPVEDAFCILGTESTTEYKGFTDFRGQITFSGPELTGRQTVTAAKEGFESTTIVEFNATDVTIFLFPIPEPDQGQLPPPMQGAVIKGELVFEHSGEFGPGPWEIVPDPGVDEVKMAYVYSTGFDVWYPPPSPALGGAEPVVTEDMDNTGIYGFKYSVFSRPGSVAVWAIAGLQNLETATFIPYAFGVTRGIVTGPGEEIDGVLIHVVHDLSQTLVVQMQEWYPPLDFSYGPQLYKCDLFVDLGGDGVIFRDDRSIINTDGLPFNFAGWMPLVYELSDASYKVVVGAYNESVDPMTGETIYVSPFSVKVISNVTHPWEAVIAEDFIGVPYQVDPAPAGRIRNNYMEFGNPGAEPDFWLVMLQTYPDQNPIWKVVLPGWQTAYQLPDLTEAAGLPEPPSGYSVWIVFGISSPEFDYDRFSYRVLQQVYWSGFSGDAFVFEF